MDDISNKIEFTGKGGNVHTFTHLYDLSSDNIAGSKGIYVFAKGDSAGNRTLLDVQLLLAKEEVEETVKRMKEDGAAYIFFKDCGSELDCDADIDDIKGSEDYRRMVR